MASPGSRRGCGSQFPRLCFCTSNHSYLHHMPYYHHRQWVSYGPQNNNTLLPISSNFYNPCLFPPPRSTSPCVSQGSGLFCPGHGCYNHSVQWSCGLCTNPHCFQRAIPNSVEQPIIALGEPHGNYVRGGLPEMRDMGRLQNPAFEICSSLGFHMRPSCLPNDQAHLHQIQPPMQATTSINLNPPSQIPSSSYGHQMNNTDDGNRNFRPSIPIEQRTNQYNPPPEVTSFGRPAIIRILDDVMLMDGVRNSDISNRWFNNEDVPYEELLNRQLSRGNAADFSRVDTDDGNRNFRPSMPVERRMTNQDNSTSEVSSIDLPAMHLQDELLDVPELSGRVKTGLSEETILRHLRTRTHLSSANNLDLNERLTSDQVPEICVICLGEYENHEKIGTLQCGHDYHAECIMKWLQRKNDCPICKAKALSV